MPVYTFALTPMIRVTTSSPNGTHRHATITAAVPSTYTSSDWYRGRHGITTEDAKAHYKIDVLSDRFVGWIVRSTADIDHLVRLSTRSYAVHNANGSISVHGKSDHVGVLSDRVFSMQRINLDSGNRTTTSTQLTTAGETFLSTRHTAWSAGTGPGGEPAPLVAIGQVDSSVYDIGRAGTGGAPGASVQYGTPIPASGVSVVWSSGNDLTVEGLEPQAQTDLDSVVTHANAGDSTNLATALTALYGDVATNGSAMAYRTALMAAVRTQLVSML